MHNVHARNRLIGDNHTDTACAAETPALLRQVVHTVYPGQPC